VPEGDDQRLVAVDARLVLLLGVPLGEEARRGKKPDAGRAQQQIPAGAEVGQVETPLVPWLGLAWTISTMFQSCCPPRERLPAGGETPAAGSCGSCVGNGQLNGCGVALHHQ